MASKKNKSEKPKGPATIQNRKASYDYFFEETHEAGIVLQGSEVKSLFLGRANLVDAYCTIENNELWVMNFDIEPYAYATAYPPERRRKRKLLMHKKEIEQLRRKSLEKGFTLIPAKVYFNNGKAKLLVAVAKGKKAHDKRDSIKEKDQRREMQKGLD